MGKVRHGLAKKATQIRNVPEFCHGSELLKSPYSDIHACGYLEAPRASDMNVMINRVGEELVFHRVQCCTCLV